MKKLTTKQAYLKALELDKRFGESIQYVGVNGMFYSLTIFDNEKGYKLKRFDKSGL